jgi:hypothetical protein
MKHQRLYLGPKAGSSPRIIKGIYVRTHNSSQPKPRFTTTVICHNFAWRSQRSTSPRKLQGWKATRTSTLLWLQGPHQFKMQHDRDGKNSICSPDEITQTVSLFWGTQDKGAHKSKSGWPIQQSRSLHLYRQVGNKTLQLQHCIWLYNHHKILSPHRIHSWLERAFALKPYKCRNGLDNPIWRHLVPCNSRQCSTNHRSIQSQVQIRHLPQFFHRDRQVHKQHSRVQSGHLRTSKAESPRCQNMHSENWLQNHCRTNKKRLYSSRTSPLAIPIKSVQSIKVVESLHASANRQKQKWESRCASEGCRQKRSHALRRILTHDRNPCGKRPWRPKNHKRPSWAKNRKSHYDQRREGPHNPILARALSAHISSRSQKIEISKPWIHNNRGPTS